MVRQLKIDHHLPNKSIAVWKIFNRGDILEIFHMVTSIDRLIENRRGRTKIITPYIIPGATGTPHDDALGLTFPPDRSDPGGHPYNLHVAV